MCLVGFRFDKTNEEISWTSHVATSEEAAGWGRRHGNRGPMARRARLRSARRTKNDAGKKGMNYKPTDGRTDGRPNFVAIYEFRNKIKTFSENNTPSGRTRIY